MRKLEALRASPKLFARKFDMHQNESVLDLIDRHLLQPERGTTLASTSWRLESRAPVEPEDGQSKAVPVDDLR